MQDKDFIIVEYDPSYAKSMAEMWNNSGEGWNGDNTHHTETSVKDKEAVSSHLNLFLALIGDKVVGYCKLSQYYFDENTLYIDLLNVEPRYYNHKIGKALVKLTVERTMELGYPRLDLFTWAGNTKAVPLYKKCGFFWEKLEGYSTHLMNFIPTVMQTPLLKGYFETLDWYDDSIRPIVVEPDGRTEHNFDFYTYTWEKAGTRLQVEFEKSGRGIHSIETEEFHIFTEISNGKLVFGQKYAVKYHITNKTNQALQIELHGLNDKNIRFDLHTNTAVLGSQTIEGEFYLDAIDVEQSTWKTHPVVCAQLSVNGKTALFKTGINPQFPIRMFAGKMENLLFAGREEELYLNVENNFDEDCTFEITFPPQQDISFAQETINIALQAHERSSIPCKVTVNNSLVYNQRAGVKAYFADGRELCFNQPFTLICYIPEGRAWGENSNRFSIINANNILYLDRGDNVNEIIFKNLKNNLLWFQEHPKLGMPYASEFQYKLPDKVEHSIEANSLTLKAYYSSDAFPGCKLIAHYKLFNSGMLEHWTELLSFPTGLNEIALSSSFGLDRRQLTLPYSGMVIQTDPTLHNDSMISNWDSAIIDENWFYCAEQNGNMGLVWHQEDKLLCCDWLYAIEHRFVKGESKRTNSMFVAFDVFPSVKKLREFALGKKVKALIPVSFYALQVNGGNPFWDAYVPVPSPKGDSGLADKGVCRLEFIDYRQNPMECEVQVSSINSEGFALSAKAAKAEELHSLSLDLYPQGDSCIDLISAKASYPTKTFCVDKILFRKQIAEVQEFVDQAGENTIYRVDNGVIQFKVSPEFAPLVYSLVYNSHEWLDNSFPERSAKSWWNPWCGGLEHAIDRMKRSAWHSEKHIVSFVEKMDNFAQVWKGIKISTKIENYDSLKGITVCQYFLVLPGLPVVATFSTYSQEGGFYRDLTGFTRIFAKADEDIRNSAFELTQDDKVHTTHCGREEITCEFEGKLLAFCGKQRAEKLYFYSAKAPVKAFGDTDSSVGSLLFYHKVALQSRETKAAQLRFIILSELPLFEKALMDLDNIEFMQ